jgi:hypothetical protein
MGSQPAIQSIYLHAGSNCHARTIHLEHVVLAIPYCHGDINPPPRVGGAFDLTGTIAKDRLFLPLSGYEPFLFLL